MKGLWYFAWNVEGVYVNWNTTSLADVAVFD